MTHDERKALANKFLANAMKPRPPAPPPKWTWPLIRFNMRILWCRVFHWGTLGRASIGVPVCTKCWVIPQPLGRRLYYYIRYKRESL